MHVHESNASRVSPSHPSNTPNPSNPPNLQSSKHPIIQVGDGGMRVAFELIKFNQFNLFQFNIYNIYIWVMHKIQEKKKKQNH